MFNGNKNAALKSFINFNEQITDDRYLDIEKKQALSDQDAVDIIKRTCKITSPDQWQKIDRKTRDRYLGRLKQEGLSVKQISSHRAQQRDCFKSAKIVVNTKDKNK